MANFVGLKRSEVARKFDANRWFYVVLYQVVEQGEKSGKGFQTFGSQLNKLSERELQKLVEEEIKKLTKNSSAKVEIATIIEIDLVN